MCGSDDAVRLFNVLDDALSDFEDRRRPGFLEQAGRELLEEEWTLRSGAELPEPTSLDAPGVRLG
jgi:hypothetical protein